MLLLEAIKNQVSGDSLTSQVVNKYIEQETNERADIQFTPKQLHDMALEYVEKSRFAPAIAALTQALQLAPTSIKFSITLIKILSTMKQKDELDDKHLPLAETVISLFNDSKLDGKTADAVEQVKSEWLKLVSE